MLGDYCVPSTQHSCHAVFNGYLLSGLYLLVTSDFSILLTIVIRGVLSG